MPARPQTPAYTHPLRLVPAALWWVLAILVLSVLSNVLHQELWAHTPAAVPVSRLLIRLCLGLLPLLGGWWLWRLAAGITHWALRWLGYGIVLLATGLGWLLPLVGYGLWWWWH